MKRYAEYKDSGVPWIGEMPKDWEVKKLKYIGEAIIGLTYSPDDVCDENEGTLVLRSSNIQGGKLVFDNNVFVNKEIPEKLVVNLGDILICSRNGSRELIGKNAIIDETCSNYSFGAFMTIFRTKYYRFIYHVFNSIIFKYLSGSFLTSTVNQLTTGNLNNMMIPFPPLQTQQSISAYLDRKTAAIDILIEDKQKLVELLKEKRQAIISEAVTKGLDKNAKMKDSGVEWIGEVPEDWETTRFKYIFKIISGNGFREELQGKDKGEYPFLKVSDINKSEMFVYSANNYVSEIDVKQNGFNIIPPDSILIAKIGEALKKNHRKINTSKCIIDNNMEAFVPSEKINYLYAYYISVCMDMFWFDNGGTVPSINNSKLIDSVIPLPALSVQQSIVSYLMQKNAEIDNLVDNITEQIEKLKEYRQASISEAVTGKVVI